MSALKDLANRHGIAVLGHEHIWQPVPGCVAQYACECQATGYRNIRGQIQQHKQPLRSLHELTARRHVDCGRVGGHVVEDWQAPKEND